MPSSFADSFAPIVKMLVDAQPAAVLDIGPGWGKYGLACREYLQHLVALEAVEVPEGRLPTQDVIYDVVHESDARKIGSDVFAGFDVVLLVDVIEHMTREEGFELLAAVRATGPHVILATPKLFFHQHDERNPYEDHVSHWEWTDFERFGIGDDRSTIDSIIYRLGPR